MRLAKFNKFRNAIASPFTREAWYSELSIDSTTSVGADGLAIDANFLYLKAHGGTSLQAIELDSSDRNSGWLHMLSGPAGAILDWSTAIHSDDLVSAGDDRGTVTIWHSRAQIRSFKAHQNACTSVRFHPTVASVVASSASSSKSGEICLWDIDSATSNPLWQVSVDSAIDSLSLSGDGKLVAAGTRTGKCTVYDPRQSGDAVSSTLAFYAAGRPTRVLWAGETPFLLSTGQSRMRERSAALWDQRNMASPLASLQLQPSTRPLAPLYDEDTRLAYLVELGDTAIRWVDADPSSATPLALLGSVTLSSPMCGCALLPKRRLSVMKGEIARIHAVVESTGTSQGTAVIPVSHVAPRRSYLDFHSDLYPDTRAPIPAQTLAQWMACEPVTIPKMSLDPAKSNVAAPQSAYGVRFHDDNPNIKTESPVASKSIPDAASSQNNALVSPMHSQINFPASSCDSRKQHDATSISKIEESRSSRIQQLPAANIATAQAPTKSSWKPPIKHARFKYLEGFSYRPADNFTNLHNVNQRFSQQNDPIRVGSRIIAISLAGAGGQVGVFRRDSPGRIPDFPATIVHGDDVVDIELDPFDPAIVATAGVDGRLQIWRVPDTPLAGEVFFELEEYVHVTADRIYQVRFNPCVRSIVGILVSEGDTHAVYIYNGLMLHYIVGKTSDGIHTFEWSPDGNHIALTTKATKQLLVYDVRTQELLTCGPAMKSNRPSRIAWVSTSHICLTGFGTGSQRQLSLFDASDASHPLSTVTLDAGPGLLVPVVDPDCRIIYVDDRGSRLTHAYEIVGNTLVELPKFESPFPSLGLATLPKKYADVSHCELVRAYRLTTQALESIGFRVPRKRPEYFQDDIFPDTADTETPAVDTLAWLDGASAAPRLINLCPPYMKPLSEAPPEPARRRQFTIKAEEKPDNTKDAISAMLSRVTGNITVNTGPFPGSDASRQELYSFSKTAADNHLLGGGYVSPTRRLFSLPDPPSGLVSPSMSPTCTARLLSTSSPTKQAILAGGPITQIHNCRVLRGHAIEFDDVWFQDGRIINPTSLYGLRGPDIRIDAHNLIVAPGLIDVQLNGAFGHDFSHNCDTIDESLDTVSRGILLQGCTSFCPTVVSSMPETYHRVLPHIGKRPGSLKNGAESLGAHVEGPFMNPKKKGAHELACLRAAPNGLADFDMCYGLDNLRKYVAYVTVAPEVDGVLDAIPDLIRKCNIGISQGHSVASHQVASQARSNGSKMITHLFNAMAGFHHRDPGI
ncbi:hypothetical protein IWW36_003041, partial [Coemansia brasiliensis]